MRFTPCQVWVWRLSKANKSFVSTLSPLSNTGGKYRVIQCTVRSTPWLTGTHASHRGREVYGCMPDVAPWDDAKIRVGWRRMAGWVAWKMMPTDETLGGVIQAAVSLLCGGILVELGALEPYS